MRATIERAVRPLTGVEDVIVSMPDKTVSVRYNTVKADLEDVKAAIITEGYALRTT